MMYYGYNGNQKLPVTKNAHQMKQVSQSPKIYSYPSYQPVQKSSCGCGSKLPKR
ncbi:hypothetical protein [Metabacillus iocasae]|uniref:Uncharacterized protein n=1 Tax=Priestia iocasae TaxID=2291674 RepID=A0ABS2QSU0_9BACI|nr:hypothetical protein [Metabacillus iocasae]MBM7702534.1 hypothetical protein [Metabacillus iocasae]